MKFHQHPLNLRISQFQAWLWEKVDSGQLTKVECAAVLRAGNEVFHASGIEPGPEANELTVAVFRQKLHVMKTRLLQIRPELTDEVRNFESQQSR